MKRGTVTRRSAQIVACCCLVLFPGIVARAFQKSQDVAAEISRAQAAQQQGDYKTAEEIYLRLLENDPDLFPAQFGLGATFYLERKYDQSNTYILKAVERQPDLFPALLLAGANFLKLGHPGQAVPYLKRAVRVRSTDEFANHNLASAEYLAGDYRAACADYIRFLRMEGRQNDVLSWFGFGETAISLSREVSGQLGDVPPSNPYRLRFLSSVYEQLEEWGLAASRLEMLKSQPAWRTWAKLHLGQVYLRQANAAPAVDEFQQALASDPESAEAHFGLGVGWLMQGRQVPAIPELVAAARRNPWLFSHPESIQQTVSSHVELVPERKGSGNPLVDAFIERLATSTANADAAQSRRFLATLHSACEEHHRENEKKVEAALRTGVPAKVQLSLAAGLLEEGDVAGASDLVRKLPPSAQSDRDLRSILEAKLAVTREKPLDAAEGVLPLLGGKQTPENCLTISTLLQEVGKQAMAEVLRISPASTFAHLLRAQVEDARHQTAIAISEYQEAVQAAPNDPTTHLKLGDYLWQKGKFDKAIVALQNGINLDPYNAPAYYQLGDCYVNMAEAKKALPFLEDAVRLDPTLDAAFKDLGKIYYDQGDYAESVRALKKVADHDSDGSVNYLLFRDYSRLQNAKEAAASLARFRELKKAHANKELFNAEVALSQEKTSGESNSSPLTSGEPPADPAINPKPN